MRYLLFGGVFYYAKGGANDFLGCANEVDSLTESEVLKDYRIDWWHIFDTKTREIIAGSQTQAHGAEDFK